MAKRIGTRIRGRALRMGVGVLAASVSAAAPSAARADAAERAEQAMLAELATFVRRPTTVDAERQRALERFERQDLNGGGVDASDGLLEQRRRAASDRARRLSRWLALDLDGDGAVDQAELREALLPQARRPLRSAAGRIQPTSDQIRRTLKRLVAQTKLPDPDGDGRSTIAEMRAAIAEDETGRGRTTRWGATPARLIARYDLDGDGVVTRAEMERIVSGALERLDPDRDGVITAAEIAATQDLRNAARRAAADRARRERQRARAAAQVAACNLPTPAPDAEIVLIGAYEGLALSTASLGGDGVATHYAEIEIEPGSRPVYLVVGSYEAMIVRLTGAAERVATVVGQRGRIGWLGLPQGARATYADPGCPLRNLRGSASRARGFGRALEVALGRPAQAALQIYGLGRMRAPSGAHEKTPRFAGARDLDFSGAAGPVWRAFLRFNPAGLVAVDPKAVVAAAPARAYRTLPQEAGLAQLTEEGLLAPQLDSGRPSVLWPNPDGSITVGGRRVYAGGNDPLHANGRRYRLRGDGAWEEIRERRYRILGPIQIPARLTGAHAVLFVLPKGAPRPTGSLGHSTLIDE